MDLEYKNYVRNPFRVEAVEITAENLWDAAEFIGTVCEEEDGSKYILVDRRMVPNVYKVTPGFWMTKMGKNVRCFPGFIFKSQFVAITDEMKEFLDNLNADKNESPDNFPEEGKIVGAEENAS